MQITSAWEWQPQTAAASLAEKGTAMNAKSKKTLTVAAAAAGLVAVLLPTGCASENPAPAGAQPGSPDTVLTPTVE